MSVVFAVPAAPTQAPIAAPSLIPVYQNPAIARALSSAHLAYQRICAERGGNVRHPHPLVPIASSRPVAHAIAQATAVEAKDLPFAMALPLPPGMQLPYAMAVQATGSAIRSGSVGPPVKPPPPGVFRQVSAALPPQALPPKPQRPPVSRMISAPPQVARPGAPPPEAGELPDPVAVDKQKVQVARNLLDRLQTETAALTQQNQERKKILAQYGAQQKAQHATQVDSDLQRQALAIEQRGSSQLMQIQQAMQVQQVALDQQAASLVNTYQFQKAEQDKIRQVYGSRLPHEETNEAVQVDNFRRMDSFDCYLGRPGGPPKPPRSNESDDT